jgi:3-phenylpropionate/cinnamic acid dioxygenase small subunit
MIADQGAIEDFVHLEAELLDSGDFDEWLKLFSEDAYYWIPLNPTQDSPLSGPSHIYETKDALYARVLRLKDPMNLPQQPASRCSRILGRIRIKGGDGTTENPIQITNGFHLAEALPHRDSDPTLRLFAGTCQYGLRATDSSISILWKRVDLINSQMGLHGVSILI